MLWNMPYMVKTNKEFIGWIFSQKNGMYFPGERCISANGLAQLRCRWSSLLAWGAWNGKGWWYHAPCSRPASDLSMLPLTVGYGPVDQGAFNQFYEKEIRGKPISKVRQAVRPS